MKDNIKTMIDTSPYLSAVNQCLHGEITSAEMAAKVKSWANGIIKAVRAERRAILADLRRAHGKNAKGKKQMRVETVTTERYFPDDPKNKVFAVDAYVTVAKCFKVEAHDKKEAEAVVRNMIDVEMLHCDESQSCARLGDMGFHYADEYECACCGEADGDGEIQYY